MTKSTKTSWSQKWWCNKPTKLQSILNTENFDALQTVRIRGFGNASFTYIYIIVDILNLSKDIVMLI